MSSAISAKSLDMFKKIATNVGHGLERKVSLCFKSNLTEISSNTWRIDLYSNVHIFYSMEGVPIIQTINPNKNLILIGNEKSKFQLLPLGHFVCF
jgi:hypothetical protein